MSEPVRVFDADSIDSIWLRETPDGAELTVDQGPDELTVRLNSRGVRALRLALARIEREAY